MTDFLLSLKELAKEKEIPLLRVTELVGDGEPETLECSPTKACHDVYSIAKLFTATAVGLLYDRGLLSLDEKICDIFRAELPAGMDPRWEKNTLFDALTFRIGVPHGFLDVDAEDPRTFTRDYLSYMLSYPLASEPGSARVYSDGAYYLAARVAEKRAGTTLDSFLWSELFADLGFGEVAWSHCPMGHVLGASGLFLHAADIVKLGRLYLTGGCYHGKRYLSEEWVALVKEHDFSLAWDKTHTYLSKGGMYGQKLMLLPGDDRVVAIQTLRANVDPLVEYIRDNAR